MYARSGRYNRDLGSADEVSLQGLASVDDGYWVLEVETDFFPESNPGNKFLPVDAGSLVVLHPYTDRDMSSGTFSLLF